MYTHNLTQHDTTPARRALTDFAMVLYMTGGDSEIEDPLIFVLNRSYSATRRA
jgi:hypothetical protein